MEVELAVGPGIHALDHLPGVFHQDKAGGEDFTSAINADPVRSLAGMLTRMGLVGKRAIHAEDMEIAVSEAVGNTDGPMADGPTPRDKGPCLALLL